MVLVVVLDVCEEVTVVINVMVVIGIVVDGPDVVIDALLYVICVS